ncbi:MAG: ATP synthase F1 subunit delta [Proteobacteria bacterium]|nr:ATP synthase F1 subunit delta [Cystobacterineae bacterium]MCL2259274.1 ATP synthase F1 subunit delta [Cystobacterineae bacterium]MCL2314336.1 ATP synthase F1 subunit delta [Pseudomonadota bacterium]
MWNISVSRRWARALLGVVDRDIDLALLQLEAFSRAFAGTAGLSELLKNPNFSSNQQEAFIESLLNTVADVNPYVANFMRLLAQRGRLVFLDAIIRALHGLADLRQNRMRGKLTTARPLSPAQAKTLQQALEEKTQKALLLETAVDKSLVGGVSIQVGNMLFDGSLKGQLENLHARLLTR